jgi:hypothetical protein
MQYTIPVGPIRTFFADLNKKSPPDRGRGFYIKLAAKYPTACCGDESGLAVRLLKPLIK